MSLLFCHGSYGQSDGSKIIFPKELSFEASCVFIDSLIGQLNKENISDFSKLEIALNTTVSPIDSNIIVAHKLRKAEFLSKEKKYSEAMGIYKQVLYYVNNKNLTKSIKHVRYGIGQIYYRQNNLNKAIEHFLSAKESLNSTNKELQYAILKKLAKLFSLEKQPIKSIKELQFLRAAYKEDGNIQQQAMTLMKISNEFINAEMLDSSQYYAEHLKNLSKVNDLELLENKAELNIAHILLLKKDYNQAKPIAQKAHDYFDNYSKSRKDTYIGYLMSKKALADILFQEGQYLDAKLLYQSGYKVANLRKLERRKIEFLKLIIACNSALGLDVKVIENYMQLSLLQDSFYNQLLESKTLDISTKYETEKKDIEIQLLNTSNRLKSLNLQRSQRSNLFATLGLLSFSIISFLLFGSLKQKKKAERQLQEKNKIITRSLVEKEILIKEIHHRVKNNLQVVSSLLSLQSDYIKDPSALSAINEGRNRVKSMALIHQNLYQESDLTGISVRKYFEKLINGLFETYAISKDKVKLQTHIEDIVIDVDIIIPLGLITNELVSNALKYAFIKKEKGLLTVNLMKDKNDYLILEVIDNGHGFDSTTIDDNIESFGYQMIIAFVEKLNARLILNTTNGSLVKIIIPTISHDA